MRAVLDTCVLFPRYLRDTLLDTALAGLYFPLWSAEILDELQRNLVEEHGLFPDSARDLVLAMNRFFPKSSIDDYHDLIAQMTNHPKDRHVLAVAVRGKAEVVVTTNLKDFPGESLAPHKVGVRTT